MLDCGQEPGCELPCAVSVSVWAVCPLSVSALPWYVCGIPNMQGLESASSLQLLQSIRPLMHLPVLRSAWVSVISGYSWVPDTL